LDEDGDLDLVTANYGDWYELNNSISVLKNKGDGTFAPKIDYTTGLGPWTVFAADVDADGDIDLAVTNMGGDSVTGNTVSILKNNGDGTFMPHVEYGTASSPKSVFAGDLDGDGDVDLAVISEISRTVSVLKNNGDGTYSPNTDYAATGGYISAADLDGDVDLDLVTNGISILKNLGDGIFEPQVHLGTGGQGSICAADLDGDTDIDLALANGGYMYGDISVVKNNGDGTFSAKTVYPAEDATFSIFASDLDNDGDLDLVASNYGCCDSYDCPGIGKTLSVFKNNGDGTFAPKVDYWTGDSPHSVLAADLDADGSQDIVVVNNDCAYGSTISVLFHKGDGTFPFKTAIGVGYFSTFVVAADLDRDADVDLSVVDNFENYISTLKNNGDATFTHAGDYPTGEGPVSAAAFDMDGDLDEDIAVTNVGYIFNPGSTISILKNIGDGIFGAKQDYYVGNHPTSIVASDLDKDGDPDLAVATRLSGIVVLKNNGDGTLGPKRSYVMSGCPGALDAFDVGGDGYPDLLVTIPVHFGKDPNVWSCSPGNLLTIMKNAGDGTFPLRTNYAAENDPTAVYASDLDGDGDLDVAVTNAESSSVSIFKNNGNGTFAANVDYTVARGPYSVFASDFDGDGDIDLVTGNAGHNSVSVLVNNGDGTFGPSINYGVGGAPGHAIASDLDGDGDADLAVANVGSVSILKNLSNHGCPNQLGDLDHDCIFTLKDVVFQLNCVFYGFGDCRLSLTDLNCNGEMTAADVVLLLLAVFAGQPLPCP
jgi:hypothetical protein